MTSTSYLCCSRSHYYHFLWLWCYGYQKNNKMTPLVNYTFPKKLYGKSFQIHIIYIKKNPAQEFCKNSAVTSQWSIWSCSEQNSNVIVKFDLNLGGIKFCTLRQSFSKPFLNLLQSYLLPSCCAYNTITNHASNCYLDISQ